MNKQLQPSQIVNRLGKYLHQQLDGAYKMKISPNTVDVYITVLYQLPMYVGKKQQKVYVGDVEEMTLDINLTTYANKIRINIIELTPDEKTISFDSYLAEKFIDLEASKVFIEKLIRRKIAKEFEDYEFLF